MVIIRRVRTSIPETPCRVEDAGTRVVQRGGKQEGCIVAGGCGKVGVVGGNAYRGVGRLPYGDASQQTVADWVIAKPNETERVGADTRR